MKNLFPGSDYNFEYVVDYSMDVESDTEIDLTDGPFKV